MVLWLCYNTVVKIGHMIDLIGILIYANSNGISGMRKLYVNNDEAGHAGCVLTEHLIDLHSSKEAGSQVAGSQEADL